MDTHSTLVQQSIGKPPARKRPRSEPDFRSNPVSLSFLKTTNDTVGNSAQVLKFKSELNNHEAAINVDVDIDSNVPEDPICFLRKFGSSIPDSPYAQSSISGICINNTKSQYSKSSEALPTLSEHSTRNSGSPLKTSRMRNNQSLDIPIQSWTTSVRQKPGTDNTSSIPSVYQDDTVQRDQMSLNLPESESTPNNQAKIIMAANVKGRTMGISYYDGNLGKLFVMQDMEECDPVVIAAIAKAQVCPTLILLNARLDDNVVEVLKFDETGQETIVEIRPNGDFAYATAKSRLISTQININRLDQSSTQSRSFIPEMDESAQQKAHSRLSNTINLNSNESIGCAGAVIGFLSRQGISHRSANGGNSLAILAIEHFAIESFMFVSSNSRSSLQIFEDESHPNIHNSIRGRKEGLSLYGLLNQTKTSQGRYLLKQWLLRPLLDLNSIYSRQQSVECFVRLENQPSVGQLVACLSHVKNIPKILQFLSRKATISEWQSILQFVYYCLKIHSVSQEILVGNSPVIQEIMQQFDVGNLADIGAFINDVLDFDESIVEGRCVVKYNVDEELDRMRHTYNGLDSFLSEIAKEISATIPSDFTPTINVIYFPQLGYLITVPMNPEWKTEQDYQLNGLSFQFSTESTVYYKNDAMRELDEHLGDIHGLIVDREIDILHGLQERILEHSQLLIRCSDICAELDVLLSLANVAKIRNYKRPLLCEKNILRIINGRHPLQELVVSSFVANDTHIGDVDSSSRSEVPESDKFYAATTCPPTTEVRTENERLYYDNMVMILSGPNSSGKSVYLKQVALITYMAHIGSFVPADSAVIGITDKILTRIQTRETVSSAQSALMTDMQQVIFALEVATDRSLVILDEFGKGTISTDGAGLFCGVIEHLAARTLNKPRVIATTHFHELFENQLLDLNLSISLNTMEVFQEPDSLEATFLFRVIPGKTTSSLGPVCAAMADMPPAIVQRGQYLSKLFQRYEMIVPILTDHEILMQKMYEELVGMLLSLDLDQSLSDENDSTMVISNQKGCDEIEQDQSLTGSPSYEKVTDTKKNEGSSGINDQLLESIEQLMEYAAKVEREERSANYQV